MQKSVDSGMPSGHDHGGAGGLHSPQMRGHGESADNAGLPMDSMAGHEGHTDMTAAFEAMNAAVEADPGVGVVEKSGGYLPLDARFTDERGRQVTLGELIDRPTLLLPVYYYCPQACGFLMAYLAEAVGRLDVSPDAYRILSLSFDASEPYKAAATTKPNYVEPLGRDFPDETWTFLTGDQENIDRVLHSIGYTVKKQDDGTFIHPSALAAIASDGKIIKYVYGKMLHGDVALAISEAKAGVPTTSIKRFLDFCFNYSPTRNQAVFNLLKIVSVATMAVAGVWFITFLVRKKE